MKEFYTAEDIAALKDPWVLNGKPVRLGVIGNPIAHSKSPQMQQAALDAVGVNAAYVRLLADTEEGAFESLLDLLYHKGFIGVNVTVPFKKRAFLAAQHRDALAELSGAVNTLVWREDGLHGYNTDGPGFERAIAELTGGKSLADLSIVILGACGGAGSALACQCALSGCKPILVNRQRPELPAIKARLESLVEKGGLNIPAYTFDDKALQKEVEHADLIVNATSLGLREGDPLPLPAAWLHPHHFVYDIVTHDTPFRRAAAARGCTTDKGLSMLLWQGAIAFEHWFATLPPIAPMREALGQI